MCLSENKIDANHMNKGHGIHGRREPIRGRMCRGVNMDASSNGHSNRLMRSLSRGLQHDMDARDGCAALQHEQALTNKRTQRKRTDRLISESAWITSSTEGLCLATARKLFKGPARSGANASGPAVELQQMACGHVSTK